MDQKGQNWTNLIYLAKQFSIGQYIRVTLMH